MTNLEKHLAADLVQAYHQERHGPPWWLAVLAVTWCVGFGAAVVWLVITIWPVLAGKMLCP
jgi:hypothetical protein